MRLSGFTGNRKEVFFSESRRTNTGSRGAGQGSGHLPKLSLYSYFNLRYNTFGGECVDKTILIAFASRKGSTAEIARAIGQELRELGHDVEVMEMIAVSSLDSYTGIVLGAPVYMQKIIEIGSFVKRFRKDLAKRPVAVFAVGMAPVSPDHHEVEDEIKMLLKSIDPIIPLSASVFAGKIDPDKLNFVLRRIVKASGSPVGDFRDWKAIAAWAREVAHKFGE
jgi:menaquinone-dependent protoporphyrinogen oxidase